MNIFAIAVAGAVFIVQLLGSRTSRRKSDFLSGNFPRAISYIFWTSVAVVFSAAFYSTFAQYQNWQEGALTRLLLPPHQSVSYFLVDVGKKIFAPWLLALLAAIILPRAVRFLNKKYKERFFYEEEFDLMRLGIFLTGYPGFLFYLVLVLGAGLFLSFLFALLGRGRAPLRWFWMPAVILTVIAANWLVPEIVLKRFAL